MTKQNIGKKGNMQEIIMTRIYGCMSKAMYKLAS